MHTGGGGWKEGQREAEELGLVYGIGSIIIVSCMQLWGVTLLYKSKLHLKMLKYTFSDWRGTINSGKGQKLSQMERRIIREEMNSQTSSVHTVVMPGPSQCLTQAALRGFNTSIGNSVARHTSVYVLHFTEVYSWVWALLWAQQDMEPIGSDHLHNKQRHKRTHLYSNQPQSQSGEQANHPYRSQTVTEKAHYPVVLH